MLVVVCDVTLHSEIDSQSIVKPLKVFVIMNGMMKTSAAADYLGYKLSYLYKLIQAREVPFYRPNGKMCFFKKEELDLWIERGRVKTNDELVGEAQAYMVQHDLLGKKRGVGK